MPRVFIKHLDALAFEALANADLAQASRRTGLILAEGTAVGRAGCRSSPIDGCVEVGYEVLSVYCRRGYARAALTALIERATTDPTVHTLRVSIRPDNCASLATIAAWPFVRSGEQIDPDDGLEHIYDLAV